MAVIAPPRRPDSHDAEFTVEPDRGGEALINEGLPRCMRGAREPSRVGISWRRLSAKLAAMVGVGSLSTTDPNPDIPLGMTARVRLRPLDQSGASHSSDTESR
jgi:hypothetical protein